jgi:hypothetical protein
MTRTRDSQQRRAERHLSVASIAATACADRSTGFPSPEQVAAAVDERGDVMTGVGIGYS